MKCAPNPARLKRVSAARTVSEKCVTAGSDVSVHMKIHLVDGEDIEFETNGLHLSRQDELAMWAALIRFLRKPFPRKLA